MIIEACFSRSRYSRDWSRRLTLTSLMASDLGWCLKSRAWSSSQERTAVRSFWKSVTVLGVDILCVRGMSDGNSVFSGFEGQISKFGWLSAVVEFGEWRFLRLGCG